MGFDSETSVLIHDAVLSVLIFLSNIVFKWVPAAFEVVLGIDITGGVDYGENVSFLNSNSREGGSSSAAQDSGISLDTTVYNPDGEIQSQDNGNASAIGSISENPDDFTTEVADFSSQTFDTAWNIFAPFSIFVSLLLAMIVVYAMIRMYQVRHAEERALESLAEPEEDSAPAASVVGGIALPTGPAAPRSIEKRWNRIESQVASEEENEWRLAILEADIILDEVLEENGFQGESIGEKLKSATRGDLKTLDLAWDAHKVRNHIAHRGSTLDINHREAKRVIAEYKKVFEELGAL